MISDANASGVSNGCVLIEDFSISQPDVIAGSVTDPTCYNGCDGSIALVVNGGVGNFTYAWSTGENTASIADLCAGRYTVTVTGLPNGVQERTFEVENPAELVIDLPVTQTFCNNQVLVIDATIVSEDRISYVWSSENGFSAQQALVTVPQAGVYEVVATDSQGCTAMHSIEVIQSGAGIDAEFAMSSQVFIDQDLVVVDISSPIPDGIEWIIPEGATVERENQDELILRFASTGEYEIGLRTSVGDCQAVRTKKVLVIDRQDGDAIATDSTTSRQQIEDFIVYPNPTSGRFTVDVTLGDTGSVTIQVFSLTNNQMMANVQEEGLAEYSIPFDISGLATGIYAIVLETPYGNALQKIAVE